MHKTLIGAALFATIALGAFATEDKTPSCGDIMKKINNPKAGLHGKIGKALKSDAAPAWDDMQKQMKDYHKLADALAKNEPPKGEKKDWEKLAKAYAENAKKLQDAINKKDKDAASKAHSAISKSCKACHDAHRE
jgi:cytochrome c556